MAKFYVGKIYRRSGFEEKCLLEIIKFSFDIMDLEKLVVFVNESNQYFYKLMLYVGFRLIKMKPWGSHSKHNRLMVSLLREDFNKNIDKLYKKIKRHKFYNQFIAESYKS